MWAAALQQGISGFQSMSALLGLLAVVYGLSLTIAAGGGLLATVSPRFRREVMGDTPAL